MDPPGAHPAGPTGRRSDRRTWILALGVALASCLVLVLHSPLFDPSRLHVSGKFVDQAGYIRTARFLVDTGRMRMGLIYPAFLEGDVSRLYMPGHYSLLALSYGALGWGTLPSLLPSLLAHVVSTTAIFLLALHLRNERAGLLAAAVYAFFPPALTYAYTAMAESTFTAATTLSATAFVWARARWRPWLGPLLLVLPFLFRETGALLVVPLALWHLLEGRSPRWKATGLWVLASVLLLGWILAWQHSDGKLRISPAVWITAGGFNYFDPRFSPDTGLSGTQWFSAVAGNASRNLELLARQIRTDPLQPGTVGLGCVLALFGSTLWIGIRRRAPFAWASGALGIGLVVLTVAIYDVKGHKAMRGVLFVVPLACAAGASLVTPTRWNLKHGLTAALLLGLALTGSRSAGLELRAADPKADRGTRLLESLGHDPQRLLLAHPFMAVETLDWAVRHYPVPWSFLPGRLEVLPQLERDHGLGTVFFDPRQLEAKTPPETVFGGLHFLRAVEFDGRDYWVYQR